MKRLFLLLLISVIGAGLAWAATVALFSPASERERVVPRGLVEEITDDAAPSPEATASPEPIEAPEVAAPAGGGTADAAAVEPVADERSRDENGVRVPRSPEGSDEGGTSQTVTQGVVSEQSTGECEDEETEAEREACEDELEEEQDADNSGN